MLPIILISMESLLFIQPQKEMPEWDWVEHSDNKNILIAQKGGKQGIIRKDGSVFLEPKYIKIKINFSILLITCFYDDSMVTEIHYRKDLKLWKLFCLRKDKKVYAIFLVVDLFCYLCRIIYNILLTC